MHVKFADLYVLLQLTFQDPKLPSLQQAVTVAAKKIANAKGTLMLTCTV